MLNYLELVLVFPNLYVIIIYKLRNVQIRNAVCLKLPSNAVFDSTALYLDCVITNKVFSKAELNLRSVHHTVMFMSEFVL